MPARRKPLPDHLSPRGTVLDLEDMPALWRNPPPDRRERHGDAGLCAGACACAHPPPQICLPAVRDGAAGTGTRAAIAGGLRHRRCSPMCWSASIAITCPCTASRRSSPARASRSTARRWRAGWAAPAGGSRPCMSGWPPHLRLDQAVCRRHADSGARSRPRQDQDRPAVGLCP